MDAHEADAVRQQAQQAFGGPQQEPSFDQNEKSDIKHVVGVVSGKGGVGKSFVTSAIAVELARAGERVGILDADITGPSIPKMFGLSDDRAFAQDGLLLPSQTEDGMKIVSTNLVLEHETDPVLWRGPMLAGILRQFWAETAWGPIDHMVIDMPPGTGDVALTVFQQLPIEGVVIVSSPQDLVQMVVGKAVKMAQMMDVPVLGLVENMSYFECPDCGSRHELFGESRAAETAKAYGIELLDQLPINPAFARSCDAGRIEGELPEGLLPKAVAAVQASAKG